MRGTTFKKGDRWYGRYDAPRTADGRRVQRYIEGSFATKGAAQAALNTVLSNMASGSWVEPSDLTVGAYLSERWLPYVAGRVRPRTAERYSELAAITSHRRSGT